MIALRRITSTDDSTWNRLMTLYNESFPPEERRAVHQLEQMLAIVPEMFFNAVEENGLLCGLASYWDLGDFYYMEHLAVFPEMRNRKIGQQILAYWKDKRAAMRGDWRTPEAELHTLELLGGWSGALLAQKLFHHKTKKRSYQSIFWLMLILQLGIIWFILRFLHLI